MEKKKKRERERKIVIDSPKKGRYFGFLQNSFLAILMLISRKLVQRREIGEKCGFFATRRPSPKGYAGCLRKYLAYIPLILFSKSAYLLLGCY